MEINNLNIAIIGAGNLGRAMALGLLDSGYPAHRLRLTRRNVDSLKDLREKGCTVLTDNSGAAKEADLIILAVKPYNVREILGSIANDIDPKKHVVVSVVTGVSMTELTELIPKGTPFFRAMPNTAADVNESITCICYTHAGPEQIDAVNSVFTTMGKTTFIQEELMDAATVMGACGIAFVMRFIRAMVQGGIEIGFDAKTASAIVTQTVKGAAELLIERGSHPESEIDKVTTPKGCTIAGLNEMEHHGFSSALIKGIRTSYERIE
ncbi:MAG TPA: pyrroline-5-carboxylate reductase [Cryomorphaceae bacterium]|nr:pyrroline-5-carboxylate reductase [Cryomorphaceae bacterium]